jgi:LysR family transcriptional regulator, nitrogen assimilation regulatory protein
MELRQLKYFVGIAELGSFTKAAVVLDVAQPALSRQIRELEIELGLPLLVRNGRGVLLTDAGVKFLGRAKMILDDADRAVQEARSLQGRPMGLVSVGLPPSIGSILSVPTVTRVRSLYPEIQLQLTEGYSGHIQEWLLSGRLDIGVLYVPQRSADTNFHRLANEHLYLLGSPELVRRHIGHAASVDFEATLNLPLILPTRPHAIRRLLDEAAAKKHKEYNCPIEVNAFQAVRDLVLKGQCFTILPVSNVLPEIDGCRLDAVRIVNPELTQIVGLMTSTHHPPSFATTTVAKVVRDLAHELVNTSAWPERREPRPADQPVTAANVRSLR